MVRSEVAVHMYVFSHPTRLAMSTNRPFCV